MGATSQRKFDQALTVMRQLPATLQPSPEEKLKLYGYYKQSVYGSCPNRKTSMGDPLEIAKWESWNGAKHLSSSDAQEKYFGTVIQFLEKFISRPHISDIINSLERGSRISEIQVSLPLARSLCEVEDDVVFPSDDEGTHSITSFHRYNDSLCMLQSPTFSHDMPEECSDDSSDDGASLSTCTIKAYNSDGALSRPSASRLGSEAEKALESLQTQVAALNERLEVMRQEIDQKDRSRTKKQNTGWRSTAMGFLRNAAVNLMVVALITAQAYRNRPLSNRVLLLQLIFPLASFLKFILTNMRKLIR